MCGGGLELIFKYTLKTIPRERVEVDLCSRSCFDPSRHRWGLQWLLSEGVQCMYIIQLLTPSRVIISTQ
jgi:hypothetical protein